MVYYWTSGNKFIKQTREFYSRKVNLYRHNKFIKLADKTYLENGKSWEIRFEGTNY